MKRCRQAGRARIHNGATYLLFSKEGPLAQRKYYAIHILFAGWNPSSPIGKMHQHHIEAPKRGPLCLFRSTSEMTAGSILKTSP